MSLAGLDTPVVVEAHQASIADPSGWFLLKYEQGSRDTVEVFQRGSGGVSEARIAVESYPDKSPLYGLVQHRRRKVILKYIPEGTSRLLQVRLTVQFQSITEAFPHDAVFTFVSPLELSEQAIGVYTMLVAPSIGSATSSTSSLHRHRLNEISEDAEEAAEMPPRAVSPTFPETFQSSLPTIRQPQDNLDELPASARRAKALLAMRNSPDADIDDYDRSTPPTRSDTNPNRPGTAQSRTHFGPLPVLQPFAPISTSYNKDLPAPPGSDDSFEQRSNHTEDAETTHTKDHSVQDSAPTLVHSPHLTAGASESISLWSSEVAAYAIKPKKKKLGPRPHVEPPGRPRTSGASETNARGHPVANMPTSVKITTDRAKSSMSLRPTSQQSSRSVPGRFPSSQSVQNLPPVPSSSNIQQYLRPESRSNMHPSPSVTSEFSSTATPEKVRLMKALQLRKRNILANKRASLNVSSQMDMAHRVNGVLNDPKLPSSSTTPTTATVASEHAEDSSFTSRDELAQRRGSLSSDTSSSVTPRATEESETKTRYKAKLEIPRRSEKRENMSRMAAPPIVEVDSDDEAPARENLASPAEANQHLNSSSSRPQTGNAPASPKSSKRGLLGMLNTNSSRPNKGLTVPKSRWPAEGSNVSGDSDADSFMDELANATVHEAKPIKVARTSTSGSAVPTLREFKDLNRVGSNGTDALSKNTTSAVEKLNASAVRSSSAMSMWSPAHSDTTPQPLTTKSSLGTNISKRIKALEVLSTRDSTTSPPRQPVRDIPSKRSAFDTFVKRSSMMMHPPKAPTDAPPPKKAPETPQYASVSQPSLARGRDEHPKPYLAAPKNETVSVTARIVRDHDLVPPSTAPGDLNLHRSPLIVEHERSDTGRTLINHDQQRRFEGSQSPVKQEKTSRFSFSSYRSLAHSATQPRLNTADSSSKVSLSSKSKMPRSMSENSSLVEDKKGSSRTQRLMSRVSNLTTRRSQKTLTTPSTADFFRDEQPQTIDERIEGNNRDSLLTESLLHVVDIGEVNVQFPDSLLWKRRFMRVDDQGYIIFSPPANDPNLRSVSRKFHLSDIKIPSIPDADREEMAWSVFLDMLDGSCIQCSCENKVAQQQVLQMLVDAHSAYSQLYSP